MFIHSSYSNKGGSYQDKGNNWITGFYENIKVLQHWTTLAALDDICSTGHLSQHYTTFAALHDSSSTGHPLQHWMTLAALEDWCLTLALYNPCSTG